MLSAFQLFSSHLYIATTLKLKNLLIPHLVKSSFSFAGFNDKNNFLFCHLDDALTSKDLIWCFAKFPLWRGFGRSL